MFHRKVARDSDCLAVGDDWSEEEDDHQGRENGDGSEFSERRQRRMMVQFAAYTPWSLVRVGFGT